MCSSGSLLQVCHPEAEYLQAVLAGGAAVANHPKALLRIWLSCDDENGKSIPRYLKAITYHRQTPHEQPIIMFQVSTILTCRDSLAQASLQLWEARYTALWHPTALVSTDRPER